MRIFDFVDNIAPLFVALENQYNKLAELEIKGLKNSKEYNDLIHTIKMTNDIISKKIGVNSLDVEEFLLYKESFMLKYNISNLDISSFYEHIFSNNNYLRRFINQLYFLTKNENLGLNEDFESVDDDIVEKTVDNLNLLSNISVFFDYLLVHTLFEYLNDTINETTSPSVKNALIQTKYKLIFLYPELEVYFLKNQNKFTKVDIFKKYLLSFIEKLDEEKENFKEIYIDYYYEIIIELATSISIMDENFFAIEENRNVVLMKTILIKTLISINMDLSTSKKIDQCMDELLEKAKSKEAKRYLLESFTLSNRLNTPKKIDL